ncbi:MAG: RIP metalloprotease RseP [Deltaproteobacteria bacterium]|nr:RIP metalloprotease RseP [Deltaproteobacteria bacterium]
MTTFVATVIVLGVLIFVHEFGHFLLAKLLGVRVEAFSLGFPPRLVHKQIGDTDYRLSVIPLGGYVKLLGENPNDEVPKELEPQSFMHHPLWHRFLIVLAGPTFNLLFAVAAFWAVFALSGIPYLTTELGNILEDSPAAHAGLQKGDLVLAVNNQKVLRWQELAEMITKSAEKPVVLSVKRGEKVFSVTLAPQLMEVPADMFGNKTKSYKIGVNAADRVEVEKVGTGRALVEGVEATWDYSVQIVVGFYKLIAREVPLKALGGPILIAQAAGKTAERGVAPLVQFMGILSVNLFLLNLLPIPVLDGGHLFFFTLEALRGKPVEIKHREMAQGVGLMLILALMILVFYQDILRLVHPPR